MIWPNPVRAGDCLTGWLEIKENRVSKSKPNLGFVRYKAKLLNRDDKEVFVTTSTIIISTKPNDQTLDHHQRLGLESFSTIAIQKKGYCIGCDTFGGTHNSNSAFAFTALGAVVQPTN